MLKKHVICVMCCAVAVCVLLCSLTVTAKAKEQLIFRHGEYGNKTVALTFDDGPHPRYTREILALLNQYRIRATFFFIGENIEYYKNTARAVVDAGHEVGNHTYSHPMLGQITTENLTKEIEKTDRLLADIGYKDVSLFRPPHGLYGEELPVLLQNISKKAILWSIDTRDWEHPTTDEILRNIEANLHGGDIILFHDYVSGENAAIPALKKLIPMLLERGYQFVTVSELLTEGKRQASR